MKCFDCLLLTFLNQRPLRANVLCHHTSVLYVPTCQIVMHAKVLYVPTFQRALRANMSKCEHSNALCVSTCQRANLIFFIYMCIYLHFTSRKIMDKKNRKTKLYIYIYKRKLLIKFRFTD